MLKTERDDARGDMPALNEIGCRNIAAGTPPAFALGQGPDAPGRKSPARPTRRLPGQALGENGGLQPPDKPAAMFLLCSLSDIFR
jgi:hypothetical protein